MNLSLRKLYLSIAIALLSLPLFGQGGFEVDYTRPKKYIVGGVSVSGNNSFSAEQILQYSGMQKGMEITIPGEDISSIVSRIWLQRYFEDVAIVVDSLSAGADSVYLRIAIEERPRVSNWTFSGVKSGEKKDLMERLNLRRGGEYSEYVAAASTDIIKRFYAEKGFIKCEVTPEVQKDTIINKAIIVNFAVDRGPRVRIKDINFIGNEDVSDFKLARSMKKTKSNKFYNFFSSKKFNEKEYPGDKKKLIDAMNEAGFRDARILRDSI